MDQNHSTRIPSLDGLRALSILLVLFGHLSGTAGFLPPGWYPQISNVSSLTANLGVRVFFVISGFLITSLLLKELAQTQTISLKHFYFRRAFRILPAAYFFIACVGVLTFLGVCHATRKDFLLACTYLMNLSNNRSWDLGHLWSLSLEEQFYLTWPACLFLLGRTRALRLAGMLLALVPIGRGLLGPVIPGAENAHALLVGCVLAGTHRALRENARYRAFLESKWFYLIPPSLFALNLASPSWRVAAALPFVNIGIALCIHRWTSFRSDGVMRFLNLRPMRALGILSYSLYLWQEIFLDRTQNAFWTTFPANLVLALVCASLAHIAIEKPFLRLRAKLEQHWGAARSTSPEPAAVFAAAEPSS